MAILRTFFLAGVCLLGAVALFLGAVVLLTSGLSGSISLSFGVDGQVVAETVERASSPRRFWQLVGWAGALPAALGATALWLGARALRR